MSMTQISLQEYVAAHGQTVTAARAGITQGAIWQMLKNGRRIFVVVGDENKIDLEERRAVPRRKSS